MDKDIKLTSPVLDPQWTGSELHRLTWSGWSWVKQRSLEKRTTKGTLSRSDMNLSIQAISCLSSGITNRGRMRFFRAKSSSSGTRTCSNPETVTSSPANLSFPAARISSRIFSNTEEKWEFLGDRIALGRVFFGETSKRSLMYDETFWGRDQIKSPPPKKKKS